MMVALRLLQVMVQFGLFSYIISKVPSQCCLVQGFGPVAGARPTSFRAEAYGVLAATRFLLQLSEFTGVALNQHVCHWIDNKGVVSRIKWALRQSWSNPNSTLLSDWDVITEIMTTVQFMQGVTYSPKWIKGHQDSEHPFETLTFAAQQNCAADGLATEFHGTPRGRQVHQRVPLMPHTKAQLVLKGTTLTSYYKRTLCGRQRQNHH
jgi:hypothetical protein